MDKDKSIVKQQNLQLTLNLEESNRLEELESIVEKGLETFYEVGKALEEIRDKRMYRQTHKTFEEYCRDKWGMARKTANRYIGAAKVLENLGPIGPKNPIKESQIRSLTTLPQHVQQTIWHQALELSSNGNPTGAEVERLVEEYKQKNPTEPLSELELLKSKYKKLKQRVQDKQEEHRYRAGIVAEEIEKLRVENQRLQRELNQVRKDWLIRIALETEQIQKKFQIQIDALQRENEELKLEIEGIKDEGKKGKNNNRVKELSAYYSLN